MRQQMRKRRTTFVFEPLDVRTTFDEIADGAIVQMEDGRVGVFIRSKLPMASGMVMITETVGVVVHPTDRARYVAWPGYATLLLLAAARGSKLDLSALSGLEKSDPAALEWSAPAALKTEGRDADA